MTEREVSPSSSMTPPIPSITSSRRSAIHAALAPTRRAVERWASWRPGAQQAPTTGASPSGSYRHSSVDSQLIICPASAATAANTSSGGAARATRVATRPQRGLFPGQPRRLSGALPSASGEDTDHARSDRGDQHGHRILRVLECQREVRGKNREVEDRR